MEKDTKFTQLGGDLSRLGEGKIVSFKPADLVIYTNQLLLFYLKVIYRRVLFSKATNQHA